MTCTCVDRRVRLRQAKDDNVQYQLHGEPLRSVSHQRGLAVIVDETVNASAAAGSTKMCNKCIPQRLINVYYAQFMSVKERCGNNVTAAVF